MINLIQSIPLVSPTPSALAMSDPTRAATMPIAIVSQMEMFCRPGSTSRPSAPMMRPTTMALMMSPSMASPYWMESGRVRVSHRDAVNAQTSVSLLGFPAAALLPGLSARRSTLQVQNRGAGQLGRRAEADGRRALHGRRVAGDRLAALDAEPLGRVAARLQEDRERTGRSARLQDEVLLAGVGQRVPRGAEVVPRLHLDQVHPLGEAQRVAHREASGLERGVWRVEAADDPEVHQDGMVTSQEGFPGPERVAAAGCVVVGVADHDLAAVGGGWVLQPAGLRGARRHGMTAVGEDVVVAGRDPLRPAGEQRLVDLGLLFSGALHANPEGVPARADRRLVPTNSVEHSVLLRREV